MSTAAHGAWLLVRHRLGSIKRELQARREARAKARSLDSRSSVTNRSAYLDFCARAAIDDEAFASFRQEPVYVNMLEHVTEPMGREYLAVIRRDNPDYLGSRLAALRANDRFGSPVTHEYPGVGRVSPVTLRYMKVLSDLELLFGDLSGKRIVEIGVGYGGQARLILERWPVANYTLVDLEPALRLAQRYLTSSGTYDCLTFMPPEKVTTGHYDLCISNYAFSELGQKIQHSYAKALVRPSDRGYLTCNFISGASGIASWPREKLAGLHGGARWVPEEPLTFEGNAILVWGDLAPNRAEAAATSAGNR